MEVLLMVVVLLHAFLWHQGIQGAAISSNDNGTSTSRSDKLVEKQSKGGGLHTPSLSGNCSGSLLARNNDIWVTVTLTQQSNETKKNMAQHCKELGCGRVFPENVTASMNTCLSDCTTINSNLMTCTEAIPDNCSNVTEVVCAWQAVQLIGGTDRCAGRVELFGTKGWGSVCDDGWDMKGGDVVCAQLGCGTAVWVMHESGKFKPGSGPIYISHLKCSGTERNLWQCATNVDYSANYCGHKEDAAVICSGSINIPVTTINTIMQNFTNWTTGTVTVLVAEDDRERISAPVLGCIVLSVTLFLLLFSNAVQCACYKRRNGRTEARRASQASQRDNSDTSSNSDYERYIDPVSPPPTTENNCDHNDTFRVGDCNQMQGRFFEERNAEQTPVLDSESTSSVEFNEKTDTEMENPAVDKFYPEECTQMTPLHYTSKPPKSDSTDSFDSDSTSSGECYENTELNAEPCLQTCEGNPSLPEQPPLSHPESQMAGSSVSQPYSPDQAHALDSESTSSGEFYENTGTETDNLLNPAVKQLYPENYIQRTPLHSISETAKSDATDSFDSDSTSSGECYENIGVNAETCLQTLEGNPSLPEQPPLSHPEPQMAGNSSVPQPCSPDQDDSSTSSEEDYENVTQIEENCFAGSERSVHSSSDSDYDDVSNW